MGEGHSVAENEAPKKVEGEARPVAVVVPVAVVPITASQFSKEFEDLFARAKAAGLNPRNLILATFARQGMTAFDRLLTALDGGD